jgi:hypothetical protein
MITTRSNHQRGFQRSKPFILHASLILFVFLYAFVGGMMFNKLEAEAMSSARKEELVRYTECVVSVSSA